MAPLEEANERLARAWGQVGHLNAVMNSPELRDTYNANLPKLTQYLTELGQNQALFEKYKALAASPEFRSLSAARQRMKPVWYPTSSFVETEGGCGLFSIDTPMGTIRDRLKSYPSSIHFYRKTK